MTASTSWGFKIVAVLVAILYIGIIVMVTNRPDKDDDEIVLSASASLKNRDYVGALYAGQGEWVDKLDMEVPVAGRSDHQVVACGSEGMLYILGGYTDGVGATVSDLVLEFDPASETYTTKASMPTPRYLHLLTPIPVLLTPISCGWLGKMRWWVDCRELEVR
jgi:hypothetical protein